MQRMLRSIKVISVSFSETMNASSFNNLTFTFKTASTTIIGSMEYSGITATFTPASALSPNTVYVVTITTGVKNTAGANQLLKILSGILPPEQMQPEWLL